MLGPPLAAGLMWSISQLSITPFLFVANAGLSRRAFCGRLERVVSVYWRRMIMTDERYKKIMADLGMPNSKSLLFALQQVANEAGQEDIKD